MSRYINEVFDSLAAIRLAEMKLRGMANAYSFPAKSVTLKDITGS